MHRQKNVHRCLVIMMGVTNHWVSLLAHKYNDQVEFWLFDSKNKVYWGMNDKEIKEFV